MMIRKIRKCRDLLNGALISDDESLEEFNVARKATMDMRDLFSKIVAPPDPASLKGRHPYHPVLRHFQRNCMLAARLTPEPIAATRLLLADFEIFVKYMLRINGIPDQQIRGTRDNRPSFRCLCDWLRGRARNQHDEPSLRDSKMKLDDLLSDNNCRKLIECRNIFMHEMAPVRVVRPSPRIDYQACLWERLDHLIPLYLNLALDEWITHCDEISEVAETFLIDCDDNDEFEWL
jgi:hypothetical protein